MKSSYALVLAVGLGIAGAALNSYYLYRKSQSVETVNFVGVAPGVTVNPGETVLREHLVPVPIPQNHVGSLDDFAVRYKRALDGVVNRPAPRLLKGGSLLLEQDLLTPPQQLTLGENELAWPIPVDTRAFVPSLIKPGDEVWFLGAATAVAIPTPAGNEPIPEEDPNPAGPPAATPARSGSTSAQIIGPFTVLALGNRLGSPEVMRRAKIRQVQENVILIKVTMVGEGLRSPADELLRLMERTNSRPLGYFWRPQREEDK